MATPNIPQKMPYGVEVAAGESYWWCACGKSQAQPFCDGSHRDTEFTPVEYKAETTATVYFCGCKHTAGGTTCDGTHSTL